MRIAVTGATGFIGTHLIEAALCRKIEVTAIKRSEQSNPSFELSREPYWINRALRDIHKTDIEDCSVVIHLASAGVSPKKCDHDEMIRTNILDSVYLMEKANEYGIKKFMTIGTAHEYPVDYLYNNEYSSCEEVLRPRNFYGATKAASFILLKSVAEEIGIDFYYGRLFNAYGKGQWEGNFWPLLKKAADNDEDFCMSAGTQICDFIKVETAVNHILDVCLKDFGESRILVEDIRSMNACTLLQFAQSEWKRLNANGKIITGLR